MSIKSNELRIGNFAIYLDGGIYKIANGAQIDWTWQPIPLTEEWLIKFGFHKAGSYWKHKNCNVIQIWEWQGSYNFTAKGNKRIVGNTVHILQNLYFALTGEELTIKE